MLHLARTRTGTTLHVARVTGQSWYSGMRGSASCGTAVEILDGTPDRWDQLCAKCRHNHPHLRRTPRNASASGGSR